jgi:protocatechuate 3,4-dioxygenase beta subunit
MDDESRPVAGAQVQVNDAIAVFAGGLPRLVATDADGSFALTAAPSDQAVLTVRATGYATHFRKNLVLPATELTITLERGLTLRLRAVDSEHPGRPAPFVRVLVRREAAFAAGETDERGELRLENLPASDSGQGEIQFSGGGYIPHKIDFGDREPVGGILDLGEVPLEPGGVVRGRVLEKETKEPIAGARVRAMGGLKDLGLQLFGTTDAESGPDGSFELKGVSRGATMVLAEHPDYVSDTEPMALLMGMRGGGRPIFAEGSREAERDVLLAPGAVLEGLVLGPDGAPVSGATVKVEDTMAFFATLLGGGPSESQTDREGRFAIKGLRPGQAVELVARHGDFGASAPTAATAGTEATVRLTEPIRLTGRVVNEADEPVSGVRVIARHKKGEESGSYVEAYIVGAGAPRPSMTDREGRYLVPSAPQGDLTVSFHHSDYMTSKTEASIASGTTERNLGTTVLRRGPTIEGMVVDEKGAPVAEARVQATLSGLTEPDAMPELREVGESIGHTTTDEKGRFSVHGLKQGHYDLTTQAKGRYGHLEGVATGTLDARIIHRGAGRLEGRVTSGGRPVRNAKARATGRGIDQFAWARSDAEGEFTLEPLPPDLPFDLVIEHDGYLKVERKGAVASDTVQEFFLDPGIQVGGIVVEHDGTPAAMATVSIRVDGRPVKMVVAGRNGRFLAGGLPAGSLAVELVSGQGLPIFGSPGPGYVASGPVPVTPGNLAIRIVAEPGETIQGVVRNPDGSLADQVQVEALDADGKSVAKTWIWSGNGAFELKGLRRGAYAIRVSTLRPGGPGGELEGVETGRQKVEIRLSE